MYQPTMYAIHGGTLASFKAVSLTKLDIEIKLDAHDDKKVYTTGSAISGTAVLTAQKSIEFDDLQITLEGQGKVALEQMSQISGHTTIEGTHTFLKLNMPVPPSLLPESRLLEAGTALCVPFNFVIPAELLPQACTHKIDAEHVHRTHCQLPPSMGSTKVVNVLPEMGRIQYYVAVKVLRRSATSGKSIVLSHSTRNFLVLPESPELAPLHVSKDSGEYQLVRTKNLKKGVFKGKLGEVTFSASQPRPFSVSPGSSSIPQTSITVNLTFNPSTPDSKPPKIGSLTTKLKYYTFVAIKGQPELAKKVDKTINYDPTRAMYAASETISNMTLSTDACWKFSADAPAYTRRDSGYETSSSMQSDTSRTGSYQAEIMIPLTLPAGKEWTPTFHSCLISRLYTLDISCSINGPSALPTNLGLRVPVQVACKGAAAAVAAAATPDLEVDEVFRPRLLSVPEVEFARTPLSDAPPTAPATAELPPGYAGGYEEYVRRESLTRV